MATVSGPSSETPILIKRYEAPQMEPRSIKQHKIPIVHVQHLSKRLRPASADSPDRPSTEYPL